MSIRDKLPTCFDTSPDSVIGKLCDCIDGALDERMDAMAAIVGEVRYNGETRDEFMERTREPEMKINPCKCGAQPNTETTYQSDKTEYRIQCNCARAGVSYISMEAAIAAWNEANPSEIPNSSDTVNVDDSADDDSVSVDGLEPIKEWDDSLIGKRVVMVDSYKDNTTWQKGVEYEVLAVNGRWASIKNDKCTGGLNINFTSNCFALLPEPLADTIQREKEQMARAAWDGAGDRLPIKSYEMEDGSTVHFYDAVPVNEVTHSCELEFPNGDIVEIPAPTGAGWESEPESIDEWRGMYWDDIASDERPTHKQGQLIFDEYHERAKKERARILSHTKWTRTVSPPVKEPTLAERCLGKYPLLNGHISNHKLVKYTPNFWSFGLCVQGE